MNTKQKEWLKQWLLKNEFEGENESGWTPPRVIHSSSIEYIYSELKKLESIN